MTLSPRYLRPVYADLRLSLHRSSCPFFQKTSRSAQIGLAGTKYVKPGENTQRVDAARRAQRPDVKEAWKNLAEREGLEKEAYEDATWFFMGVLFGRSCGQVMSMSKARKFGWTGYCDNYDAVEET